MFDFQKLTVYQKSKALNSTILQLIAENRFDNYVNDQLKRATFSIMLNIAEGSSRFSNKDRKNFLVISRGSAFECVAILDFLIENHMIVKATYDELLIAYEEISKMLYAIIQKLD